jgi:hypothetical protein
MSTPAIAAPYLAEVALLGFAGVAKLSRPETTARALRQAGFRAKRSAVRAGAAAELAVAVAALAYPSALTGALVGVSYAAFTVFVVAALRYRWPLSSCGCFAKPDTPPTKAHALLDAGAVVCAAWWAASRPVGLGKMFSGQPWHGAPLGLVGAAVALLAYVVWTNPIPSAIDRSGR